MCVILPNFIKIGQAIAEIWPFNVLSCLAWRYELGISDRISGKGNAIGRVRRSARFHFNV